MSVAKRKWGESLSARREELQKAQLLLRGVTYNLHRLVLLGLLRVRTSLKRHSPYLPGLAVFDQCFRQSSTFHKTAPLAAALVKDLVMLRRCCLTYRGLHNY